jgi:hypothetical protein
VKLVHLVGFIIKKSHIFVDTNGRIADIQVNFRRDKTAMEGENRRIINRVTEVKNVDGTYRRERS